jgi:hypothetical protein
MGLGGLQLRGRLEADRRLLAVERQPRLAHHHQKPVAAVASPEGGGGL